MVKVVVVVKKRSDLSLEEFSRHWRTVHKELVLSCPASRKYIRRYHQCHILPETCAEDSPFHGTAELWFDSAADVEAFFSDPDYFAMLRPDEQRFADMGKTKFLICTDEQVIG